MLGSAAQNVIVLTDNVFLYHLSSLDFASIGVVGVFYLMIASIGYGFSRGGQIIIARRYGERNYDELGQSFYALLFLELVIAIILFILLQYGSDPLFSWALDNPEIKERCLEYIYPRSYGVFFSYVGLAIVGLYTGIARTRFIIIDTMILVIINLVLNYVLIFGKLGLPQMGIRGAAYASTIAEIVALAVFVLYVVYDRKSHALGLFRFPKLEFAMVRQSFSLSMPLVLQTILGLGSWFIFFSLIENMGQRELEISNLIRNVYLILSIPCWGYAAGINTLVSNFIGQRKRQAVLPIIWKTSKINLFTSLAITIPVVLFPAQLLYPLFGGEDMSLIHEAQPTMLVLLGILVAFSLGGIFFNGLAGTGATGTSLGLQAIATTFYLIYIFVVIKKYSLGLQWAWACEIFYWLLLWFISYWFIRSNKWHFLRI
jgi:putative MATE family efflux protein